MLLFNSSHSNSYDVLIGLFLSYALIEDMLLSLLIIQKCISLQTSVLRSIKAVSLWKNTLCVRMKICSTSEFPSRTSFIKPLTKELTMYKTVLSRLQIGSSNTKTLRLDTFATSTEPFANCKKYKNDINVSSPSLNVLVARVPSIRCI